MNKRKRSRRYKITSNNERQLANFIYAVNLNLININEASKIFAFNHEEKTISVDENQVITTLTSFKLTTINLLFSIELLFKHQILNQSENKILEIFSGEDGHNLSFLYAKLDSNFKEKLKTTYYDYLNRLSPENIIKIIDIEELIDINKKSFVMLRYSFFTEIDQNNSVKKHKDFDIFLPNLQILFHALYELSELKGKESIEKNDFKIEESKITILT